MPHVFKAISPHYAFRYFFSAGQASWVSLNGILLCVSGSEALFADMGHFSHTVITVSPFSIRAHWSSFSAGPCICDLPQQGMILCIMTGWLKNVQLNHGPKAENC